MRCNICDRDLSPDEIKINRGLKGKFEPCGVCLDVIKEVFEADDEKAMDDAFNRVTVEALYEVDHITEGLT